MTKKMFLVIAAVLILAAFTTSISAQDGFRLNVDAMRLSVSGGDVHIGDVFTNSYETKQTPRSALVNYGVKYTPLVTRPTATQTVLFETIYRMAQRGIILRGR